MNRIDDLEAAIHYGHAALEATPPGDPLRRADVLSELGKAYRIRFEWAGAAGDLDTAIEYGGAAVRDALPGDPARPPYLSSLGVAYLARFSWFGDNSDLAAAINYSEEAVNEARGDVNRSMCLTNLGLAHRVRFEHAKDASDLDAAVRYATEALEILPGNSPDRAARLSNIGIAYQARFDQTHALRDISSAIDFGLRAVEATSVHDRSRAKWLSNVGVAYRARATRLNWLEAELQSAIANATGAEEDLNAAVRYGTEALDVTPVDHPDRATFLTNLGYAYHSRYLRELATEDRAAAIRLWADAASSPTAGAATRTTAAWEWGAAGAEAGDALTAIAGFEATVNLLPVLAWHGLDRATREEHLTRAPGLASDAASWAVETGSTRQAVEFLEAGRSVIWSQVLQTRTDVTRLRDQHPEQASHLNELRVALDRREEGLVASRRSSENRSRAG